MPGSSFESAMDQRPHDPLHLYDRKVTPVKCCSYHTTRQRWNAQKYLHLQRPIAPVRQFVNRADVNKGTAKIDRGCELTRALTAGIQVIVLVESLHLGSLVGDPHP
jgi:hypothetical protein